MTTTPNNSIKFGDLSAGMEEVIRLDKEGFHYRDQFIADAGEAHRLLVEYLKRNIQPEPEGPTDEELWQVGDEDFRANTWPTDAIRYARAVLARCGRPAIKPVPVSERLPGPEDCASWPGEPEATPWCWAGKDIDGGWEWSQISMLGLSTDTLSRIIAGGGWTHWLPHHALPVPTTRREEN